MCIRDRIDGVGFDSPAEQAGLDFDQVIQEVSVPRSSLPKELMYLPALALVALIWKLQSARRRRANPDIERSDTIAANAALSQSNEAT